MWWPPFWPPGSGRTGFRPAASYQKTQTFVKQVSCQQNPHMVRKKNKTYQR
jgi:hypothetical protein